MANSFFQLWGFQPGSNDHIMLPKPLSWNASFALSDTGALQLVYPIDAPGVDILSGYCDVEVRYWSGSAWVCPPQGRFSLMDTQVDPVQESTQPTRTYTLVSYGWLLSFIKQYKFTDLNDQGERVFPNSSIGQIVGTLIAEAKAAGAAPDLTYTNSAGTGGTPPPFAPGKSVSDILATARDQGLIEWLVQPDTTGQGRKLVVYSSVGVDRSVGDDPVILRYSNRGEIVEAPSKITRRDMAPSILVRGDNNGYLKLTNPGADIPYGMLQTYVTAGGLTDEAALQIVAQATLDQGAKPRAQHTRSLRFDKARWLPFRDYSLGDTILGPDENGDDVPLRLRQVTITMDSSGISGNVVLGDRFEERDLKMARTIARLTGGATAVSGSGSSPTSPSEDNRKPAAPSGFNVGSDPYTDADGTYQALANFGWINPTKATDGSSMTPAKIELEGRPGTSGSFRNITAADYPAVNLQWSPFDAGSVWQFRVRALSPNGKAGPYSTVVQHTMAKDFTPPPRAATPTAVSRLGTATLTWNGRGSASEVMPADFRNARLERANNSGFTSGKKAIGYYTGAGDIADAPLTVGTTYYYRIITIDRAGNEATPSGVRSIKVVGVTGPDLVANSVTANKVNIGTLSAISSNLGQITAGTITGAVIRTAASGERAEMSGRSFTTYDNKGNWTFNATGGGFVGMRSAITGTRFVIDGDGFKLYKGSSRTVWLNANDGSATLAGPIISGGTITAATFLTGPDSTNALYINSNGLSMRKGGTYLVRILANGTFYLRSRTTGSRIDINSSSGLKLYDSSGYNTVTLGNNGKFAMKSKGSGAAIQIANNGLKLWNKSGTRTVFLDGETGNATLKGTLTAGTVIAGHVYANGNEISQLWASQGARLTGSPTISGGTATGFTHSSGSMGAIAATGFAYGSGSGGFRSSNGSSRVEMSGSSLDLVSPGSGNRVTISGSGVAMNVSGNLRSIGSVSFPSVYDQTTTGGGYVTVASDGAIKRYNSSIAHKVGIKPIDNWRRILDLQPVTWMDDDATDGRRTAGFLAEQAERIGVEEIILRGPNGWADGVQYLQVQAYHHAGLKDHDDRIKRIEEQLGLS